MIMSDKNIVKPLQTIFFLLGPIIVGLLLFKPQLGIDIFWNILIPIAPLMVFLLPGLWRNICPLAYTSLLPSKFGMGKKLIISNKLSGTFQMMGVILLFIIAPLRHVGFNLSGEFTGILLLTTAFIAIILGYFYAYKSAWCNGLCPVHPVEKLYGSRPLATFSNLHCSICHNCTKPCPDSTTGDAYDKYQKKPHSQFVAKIMYGGFPGFVWGWFQVKDYAFSEGIYHLGEIYFYPYFSALITFCLYLMIRKVGKNRYDKQINLIFASTAIYFYYWFRIPQLIGFGEFKNNGMLVDLTSILGPNHVLIIQLATGFFIYFLSFTLSYKSWSRRPNFYKAENINIDA